MNRAAPFLPFLLVAPLLCFTASYLEGLGALPRGLGSFISGLAIFPIPWAVAWVVVRRAGKLLRPQPTDSLPPFDVELIARRAEKTAQRLMWIFLGALILQAILIFIFPSPDQARAMGEAHRFRR